MLSNVKSIRFKDNNFLNGTDSLRCKKSFLNKKNRWYAGMFYFHSPNIYKYGYFLPMIGYRRFNQNGTFIGFNLPIIPEWNASILYSLLLLRYEAGVAINKKKDIFLFIDNSAILPFIFVPNINLNYERCISKKIGYSINFGAFISPALGEKSEWRGLMRGYVPVEH